jgi:hypothetical protein
MKRRRNTIGQWAVRILCAIAIVFLGFAHRVPEVASDDSVTQDLSQYVLPDGSLPTICVTVVDETDNSQHGKTAHLQSCEACRIASSVLVPERADVTGESLRFATVTTLPMRAEAFHRQLYPPNTGPRAPPSDPIPV